MVAGGAAAGDGRTRADALDYRALFAAVPAACVVLDRSLRIVTLNEAYTEVTGRTEEELAGMDFFRAYPADPGEPTSYGAEAQRHALEMAVRVDEVWDRRDGDTWDAGFRDATIAGHAEWGVTSFAVRRLADGQMQLQFDARSGSGTRLAALGRPIARRLQRGMTRAALRRLSDS